MSTRPYHHGDLPNALLDAAESVLAERGLQGFTLRECARRAEVSHAAPKHHFGDVRGLLTALAARGFSALLAELQISLGAAEGSLPAEFEATARAYAAYAEARPEHFRIMFRCDLLDMEDEALRDAMAATYTELTNVIRRQRGEAEIDAAQMPQMESAELLNDILIGWCFIHGYAHLQLEQQLGLVPENARDSVRDRAAVRLSDLIRRV